MKKRSLLRASAFVSAAVFAVSAVSCGKSASSKEAPTADKVLNNSYRSEPLTADLDLDDVESINYIPDKDQLLIGGYKIDYKTYEQTSVFYLTDTSLGSPKELKLDMGKPANGEVTYRTEYNDGKIFAVVDIADYGNMKAPEWWNPDFNYEDFDEVAFEKGTKHTYKLLTYDLDGKKVDEKELDVENLKDQDGYYYTTDLLALDGDEFLIGHYGEDSTVYTIMDKEGKFSDDITVDGIDYVSSAALTSDGSLAITGYGENTLELHILNSDGSGEIGDPVEIKEGGYLRLIRGNGDYDIYASGNNGFLGFANGEFKELVNYVNSDIDPQKVSAVTPVDKGDFILAETSYNYKTGGEGATVSFSRLTARNADEMKSTKIITLAVDGMDPTITSMVTEYNKKANGYRIQITDYSKFNEYGDGKEAVIASSDELEKDIIADKGPDMMIIGDQYLIEKLAHKNALADMYEFMDKDTEVKKDMFLPSALNAFEQDGKLVQISPSISIETWVIKKKFCDHDNWSLDDMIEAYKNRPEGASFTEDDCKDSALMMCWPLIYSFVDAKNGKCSFDDPDFIKILEFCNQFPEDPKEYDFENMTDEDWENYLKERDLAYLNDKALLNSWYMYDMHEYNTYKEGYFGEDISLVGYPGKGAIMSASYNTMAIMNDSPSKDECWNFIKNFFTEEYQENMYELPVTTAAFEKKLDESMDEPFYINEKGEKEYYPNGNTMEIGGIEKKITPLTKEERDYIYDYVKNSTVLNDYVPEGVQDIIQEEIDAYFAGEQSAKEAADMIQNRTSILVSEQS